MAVEIEVLIDAFVGKLDTVVCRAVQFEEEERLQSQ
jgi:hypothetical protein